MSDPSKPNRTMSATTSDVTKKGDAPDQTNPPAEERKGLIKKQIAADHPTWCPGCGDFSVLEQSIKSQVYTLPDTTVIYPGHGPNTSVAQEKRGNPFVRA